MTRAVFHQSSVISTEAASGIIVRRVVESPPHFAFALVLAPSSLFLLKGMPSAVPKASPHARGFSP